MRIVGIVAAICIFAAVMPAHADTGFFYCAEVVDGVCAEWVSVMEGIVSMTELGVTPAAIGELMAYGFGIVFAPWFIGQVAGSVLKAIKQAVGEREL